MLLIIKKFRLLLSRKQQRNLIILLCMMIIGAILEVMGVSLMFPLITTIMNPDIMETNAQIKRLCMILNIHTHQVFVILCIILLIVVFIIKDLFLIFQYYAQARFVANNRFIIQRRLLHAFILRPYEYFLNAKSGEILRIISEDVGQAFALLTAMLSFATETIISLALITTVSVLEPVMTLLIAVSMCLAIFVISKIVKPILRKEGLSLQKNRSLANKWLLQAISGIKEVKITHTETFFEENYNQSGTYIVRAEQWYTALGNIPRLLIEMVSVCSMLLFVAIMILLGRDIESLIPSIGAFAMAAIKLLPSANRIVVAFNAIAYQEPALNKTLESLAAIETDITDIAHTSSTKIDTTLNVNSEIILKGISFTYPNSEVPVLSHADMVIPVGKSVGIVGTSGAGKTTAVDILLGLLKPQKGQILIDDMNIMENYSQWLTMVGYIPQSIFMLDDTIRANVAFGLCQDEQDDKQVWHALEEAQLADFIRSLPQGLDTTIGERGVRLSGGQRQRIGIARALYTDPEILIFDEATSALDNETEAAIMESIHNLHGKKTLVIIAHRLQTIEGCDIVYRVHQGKIERER